MSNSFNNSTLNRESRGFAFITYETKEEAKEAIFYMNN